ncbi:hypothetical protein O6H91_Y554600 [Diphasiastrum complanatum]|nr:hypothetical protein O6H91_Y554600 [Diphasiastrum complanatum]
MADFKVTGSGFSTPSQKHNSLGYFGFNNGAPSPSWFDVRVLYARVSSGSRDENPECLTVKFLSRNIDTALEVNGGRISPSEEPSLSLRRDRVDVDSLEVTYVTTNNLRTSGSLAFEIYDRDEILISGALQKSESVSDLQVLEGFNAQKFAWNIECCSAVGPGGCALLKGRQDYATIPLAPPVVEICVVGHVNGCPVILTHSVELTARRRLIRRGTLDAIPEDEECDRNRESLLLDKQDGQVRFISKFRFFSSSVGLAYLLSGFGR